MREAVNEVWEFRVYLKYETMARLTSRLKGTYLGFLWWLLDPLIYLLIFYTIFGKLFHRSGGGYLVYLFLALLPWRWFSSAVSEACSSIRASAPLIKQVYLPKVIIPFNAVLSNTISFFFSLIVLAVMLWIMDVKVGVYFLYLPVVVFIQFLFTVGMSLLFADFNIHFKDTSIFLRYILQIWFWLSPGVYHMSQFPPSFRQVLNLNPFTHFFTAYRDCIMHNRAPHLAVLLTMFAVSLILVYFGISRIAHWQGEYAKTL